LAFSRRELTLHAELSLLPEIRAFAEAAAREFGFGDDDRYQVKSAVNEAAANAIEHGSASREDSVQVEAAAEDGALVFYVRDTGTFRPRVWRGGEISERGRGLEFIARMMDEVDVRPGERGTELRMSKRL
jgi:anti-sigma regulatory factor (Ser/Thr protein kinase)